MPCQTGDHLEVMRCPNMKPDGSGWDFDHYKCAVCGKSHTTFDDEMK